MQSDVGSIQSDQGASQSAIDAVASDIKQLNQDDQTLQSDRTTDPADVPSGTPSESDIQAAIQTAQGAVAKLQGAGRAALAQANQLEATAAAYQSKSDAACKAAGGS